MSKREHGVVLTYVNDLEQLADCVRRGGYDTVKVVTGWGVEGGWTPENKARVLEMVPNVIVRTVAGDPSYAGGAQEFPEPERVREEIAPWYAIKPDISIEIGNEPNINDPADEWIWKYRYYLASSVKLCRQQFPRARLIAGGLILRNARRFCQIAHDAMDDCDMIGMHVYEYFGFEAAHQPSATRDLPEAITLYNDFFQHKPWYITEYGINDTSEVDSAEKGKRYACMVHLQESHPRLPGNIKGAVYYHLGVRGDLHPEYHIYPAGDESYGLVVAHSSAEERALVVEEGPAAEMIPQLITMIATLSEREHELNKQRAAARSGGSAFSEEHLLELHQVQSLRATLEAALACAEDNCTVALGYVDSAVSQIDAWCERQEQIEYPDLDDMDALDDGEDEDDD